MINRWDEILNLIDADRSSFQVNPPHKNDVLFAVAGYGRSANGKVQISSHSSTIAHEHVLLDGSIYDHGGILLLVTGFHLVRFILLRLKIEQPPAFPGEKNVPTEADLWQEAQQTPANELTTRFLPVSGHDPLRDLKTRKDQMRQRWQ